MAIPAAAAGGVEVAMADAEEETAVEEEEEVVVMAEVVRVMFKCTSFGYVLYARSHIFGRGCFGNYCFGLGL